MDPIDLDKFRAKPTDYRTSDKTDRMKQAKVRKWFVKGPIPGKWLVLASKTSCTALRVGLALWYLRGTKKSDTVKPTWWVWERFHLPPDSAQRGLRALERARLIDVERHPGSCPVVTIRDVTQ